MKRPLFPLFQSHLDLAHDYWASLVQPGDIVIDATCGNGHDTLKLARLALNDDSGAIYALDIQAQAIETTRSLLKEHLPLNHRERIHLHHGCHSTFPSDLKLETVKLIVYNLGYLPGGDKALTTLTATTLSSIQNALKFLEPGGCLSITTYPGHAEGSIEENHLIPMLKSLDTKQWSCCYHRWINRGEVSPGLILVQRALGELSAM